MKIITQTPHTHSSHATNIGIYISVALTHIKVILIFDIKENE